MNSRILFGCRRIASSIVSAAVLSIATQWVAHAESRSILVLAGTNQTPNNSVAVFELSFGLGGGASSSLTFTQMLPTGGVGGASGNAGGLQFGSGFGAVVNHGSNSVTRLDRANNTIVAGKMIPLPSGCTGPVSVALKGTQMFVVGANCAQSYAWPAGIMDGAKVALSDTTAAQIVAGNTWAGITLESGSVLQLPLSQNGSLAGTALPVSLPADANNTPLGAAFWGNVMGFLPAHSPNSFVLLNSQGNVSPVLGPQPPYPTNAPCWLAKGAGNIWYSGNSPGMAISIFFSDGEGGVFYKSVSLPGTPTDITVSADGNWLAVIYSAAAGAHVAVFSIDSYGDLTPVATSPAIGVTSFNGVAISL